MKQYLRASSMLFNTPLLVTPEMLDLGVRWANQAMNLNIINIQQSAPPGARMMDDDDYGPSMAERASERRRAAVASTGVDVIGVHGVLVSRDAHLAACETMTSYESLRTQLKAAVADPAVEHIVLDIDSPGGAAVGAFEMAADIRAMSKVKPITAMVNFMAFSGGYLLAAASSSIVVSRTSGVGSIGVIASHIDRSAANEKVGVKVTTVYRGSHKNDLTPHEAISEQSLKVLDEIVEDSYQMFLSAVADYRGISVEAVRATEAGLFRGEAGIKAGLADRMESPQDAVDNISRAIAGRRSTRPARSSISVRAAAAAAQTLI